MDEYTPIHFIGEVIAVHFKKDPTHSKSPHCPDGFTWREKDYHVVELLGEWRDYERRGRFRNNMQPQHAARAASRGSWGVGRFFFRVFVDSGQIFELYYDRSPKDVDDRLGSWHLFRELEKTR